MDNTIYYLAIWYESVIEHNRILWK